MAGDSTSEQTGFSGPQAAEIVGVSYRQLDYWDTQSVVKPALSQAAGSGSRRRYSRDDLFALGVANHLRDAGLSLARIGAVIERLRSEPAATAMTAVLVITATDVVFARSETELVDAVQGGPAALNVVTLSAIRSDLDAAIEWLVPDAATRRQRRSQKHRHGRPAHLGGLCQCWRCRPLVLVELVQPACPQRCRPDCALTATRPLPAPG